MAPPAVAGGGVLGGVTSIPTTPPACGAETLDATTGERGPRAALPVPGRGRAMGPPPRAGHGHARVGRPTDVHPGDHPRRHRCRRWPSRSCAGSPSTTGSPASPTARTSTNASGPCSRDLAAAGERSRPARDGPRPVQGGQRRARPPRRRPAAGRSWPSGCADLDERDARRPARRRRVRRPRRARSTTSPRPLERGRRGPATRSMQPFQLDDVRLQINASIGIALYPEHATDAADARAAGRRRDVPGEADGQRPAPSTRPSSTGRASGGSRCSATCRAALDERQLVLHFQPRVDLRSGAVVRRRGAGALEPPRARAASARRVHRARRAVGRDPAADPLGPRRGGAVGRRSAARPATPIGVAVNLSVRNLYDRRPRRRRRPPADRSPGSTRRT